MTIQTIGKLKVAHGHFMGYAVGGYGETNLDALNNMFAECDYIKNLNLKQNG